MLYTIITTIYTFIMSFIYPINTQQFINTNINKTPIVDINTVKSILINTNTVKINMTITNIKNCNMYPIHSQIQTNDNITKFKLDFEFIKCFNCPIILETSDTLYIFKDEFVCNMCQQKLYNNL